MSAVMNDIEALKVKLKRAHLRLMKHPETCLYAGVVLMGESSVVEDQGITAYTDGFNKRYGSSFIASLGIEEMTGLVLHENLHVVLKHLQRYSDLMKEDRDIANAAMDYVVNDIIMSLKDKDLCRLPKGGCYDPMFHNWSVREVWDYLRTGKAKRKPDNNQFCPEGKPNRNKDSQGRETVNIGGKQFALEGFDEHDSKPAEQADVQQVKQVGEKIDEALRHGALLAGRFGVKAPRVIDEMLQPKVDWRKVLRDFVASSKNGRDEFTWRRLNRRRLADDYYVPTTEDESTGEIVVAIDTSGSIGGAVLAEFLSELASICEVCSPEKVRVLWWDTTVHGEQIFTEDYQNLRNTLKPVGGGGTRVSCVGEYMNRHNVKPQCALVFTDGYLENNPKWGVDCPVLWLVTRNKQFNPPVGVLVPV